MAEKTIKYIYPSDTINAFVDSFQLLVSSDMRYAELYLCEDIPPMPITGTMSDPDDKGVSNLNLVNNGNFDITRMIHARIKIPYEKLAALSAVLQSRLDMPNQEEK